MKHKWEMCRRIYTSKCKHTVLSICLRLSDNGCQRRQESCEQELQIAGSGTLFSPRATVFSSSDAEKKRRGDVNDEF